LWIDDTLVVDNGGIHGATERSGKISLEANKYYPIKIRFGNNGGPGALSVHFSHNNISKTTNGSGFYYYLA